VSITSVLKALPRRVLDVWFAPVSPHRLRFFERVFALTFLYYMADWFQDGYEWLTPFGYHIARGHQNPIYPEPWPPLPEPMLPLFAALVFGSTLAVVFGVGRRVALWLLVGSCIYIELADLLSAFTLNSLYNVTFFVLAIQPRPRPVRIEGEAVSTLRQSAWPIRIIQATLMIQYGTAGMCKLLHGDWLETPYVLYTHSVGIYRTAAAAWLIHFLPHRAWPIIGYSALAFEVLAPVLLLIRKLRPVAFVWGWGFQLVIALMMKDLIYFSLQMMSFYLLFLPEAWVVRWEEALQSRMRRAHSPGNRRKAVIALNDRGFR
jgi:hypothetical protein